MDLRFNEEERRRPSPLGRNLSECAATEQVEAKGATESEREARSHHSTRSHSHMVCCFECVCLRPNVAGAATEHTPPTQVLLPRLRAPAQFSASS